jgi:anti-anti-sigma regulatory factor
LIEVDLSELAFLDASGVGALLFLHRLVRRHGHVKLPR